MASTMLQMMACIKKAVLPGAVYLLLTLFVSVANATLQYTIQEEEPGGTLVGNIKIDSDLRSSYDNATFQSLTYHLRYETGHYALFTIDQQRGRLETAQVIDREEVCANMDPCLLELDITIRPTRYFQIIKVSVHILDINDHRPEFAERKVIRAISETILPNVKFPIPSAEDLDSGVNGISAYELTAIGNTSPSKFSLETTNNIDGTKDINLVLLEPLNREEEAEYSFRITAYDGGNPPKSGSILIDITVTDANDNNPVFDDPTYEVVIPENTDIGTTVVQVRATDPDAGDNGRIMYNFSQHTADEFGGFFRIVNTTGEIIVNGELDYETKDVFHLTVTATDLGPNALPAFSKVIVRLTDENDQPPNINVNTLTASGFGEVAENSPVNTFVAHVSVSDDDEGIAGEVECRIEDSNAVGYHLEQIFGSEYKVVTSRIFDAEERFEYMITLTCSDNGVPSLSASQVITVHIMDENDHAPRFHQPIYYSSFDENNNVNSVVTRVTATDNDKDQNAVVSYSLRPAIASNNNLLRIDSVTGIITTRTSFDFEEGTSYKFIVTAYDHGETPLSSTATLSVSILDTNDESPIFEVDEYFFSVAENQPVGSLVNYVSATDRDAFPFGDISFYIDRDQSGHGLFDILTEGDRGRIVTSQSLDREARSSYEVVVVAHNEGYFNTESTVIVVIDIIDENDNDPFINFPNPFDDRVEISNKFDTDTPITKINATDRDVGLNGQLIYSLTSGNDEGYLHMDNMTGVITALRSLKDIKHKMFNLGIAVRDSGIPQRLAVGDLKLIVDRGVSYGSSDGGLINKEILMIILGVILSVLLLFVVIVIIICCVCYRQKRVDKAHKYNCRLEANKTLISSPASKRLAIQNEQNNSRQNSFNMCDHKPGPDSPTPDPDYRTPDDIDLVPQGNIYGKPVYKENGLRPYTSPADNSGLAGDMECSKMPDVVNLSHTEVDSECSGADSGKGTSEEGDNPWPQNQSNNSSPNSDIITPSNQLNTQSHHPTAKVTNDPQNNIAKQLYNLDPEPDLDLYQGHDIYQPPHNRHYASLTSFGSKSPNPISSASPKYTKPPIYSQVGNVDKHRYSPSSQAGVRNAVDIHKYPQSSVANSHSTLNYPVQYTPGLGDSSLGVTFGNPRRNTPSPRQDRTSPALNNQKDKYVIDNDAVPVETWMGREGSARGGDSRTHLFGSSNTLPVTNHKSAFKAVGKNGTLKKNVRFADKNEEVDISVDEEASSCDQLSDDGTSITSGTYVLEDGTYVLNDGGRTMSGDTFV